MGTTKPRGVVKSNSTASKKHENHQNFESRGVWETAAIRSDTLDNFNNVKGLFQSEEMERRLVLVIG